MTYRPALLIFALLSCLYVTLAQQTCYWPDGSTPAQNEGYVNCYSNQDSHCCVHGEVCLGNGLCYGSAYGWVRSARSMIA